MDVQEPNPGRLAKRDEQRRQRRSVFMTALIGATVTAVLAAAAAFRIKDVSDNQAVKVVPTTTTTLPAPNTTADTDPDTTLTTLFVPSSVAQGSSPTTTKKPATTTVAPTTTTPPIIIPHLPPIPIFPPTTVAPPPTTAGHANDVWSLSPGSVTVQSGGQATVTIAVVNEGNANGLVVVPPCPAAPRSYKANSSSASPSAPLDNACHSGQQVLLIRPGQRYTWTDTVAATNDATRYGSALSPGNYVVLVNKSPSPTMFLRMTVTS